MEGLDQIDLQGNSGPHILPKSKLGHFLRYLPSKYTNSSTTTA